MFSPFGALVSIRRDQKFKSHFNNTATDREHLIRACKASTFGTNHETSSYLDSQPPNTLSQSTSSTQNSNVNVSRLLTFCVLVQRHKNNIQTSSCQHHTSACTVSFCLQSACKFSSCRVSTVTSTITPHCFISREAKPCHLRPRGGFSLAKNSPIRPI